MSAVAFDTLKFAQALRDKAKLTPEQAEGISQAFHDTTSDQLANRGEVKEIRQDLIVIKGELITVRAEIAESEQRVKNEFRDEMASMKQELQSDITSMKQELQTRMTSMQQELQFTDASLKQELHSEIASVKQELHSEIASVKQELHSEIASVKQYVKSEISDAKADILKWMFGAIGFQTLVILGAVIVLARMIGKS